MRHMLLSNRTRGFSTVELTLVMTIIPIITMVLIVFLFNSIFESRRSASQATYDSRAQEAMDWLERDIRYATEFSDNLDLNTHSDPVGYNAANDFSYAGQNANSRTLIIMSPSTTQGSLNSARQVIYQDDYYRCAIPSYNPPLLYASVYFLKNGTLYKRTLPASGIATCGGVVAQKRSCPRTTPGCTVFDEIIAQNVSRFSVSYYSSNGTHLSDAYTNASDLLEATTVEIILTLTSSGGNPVSSTITLRNTRIN